MHWLQIQVQRMQLLFCNCSSSLVSCSAWHDTVSSVQKYVCMSMWCYECKQCYFESRETTAQLCSSALEIE